ncbi:MAG: TSCPD domain-containing protein [Nitrospirae bacterium]|nr:TSCPD domain-containing protein [Nitrospirota bacterium]
MKRERPSAVEGRTYQMKTGCGSIYVTVNTVEEWPFEVFLNMGKAGGCAFAQSESIGRLISYALRIGGDIREITKELRGIRCHQTADDCVSCADAVAKVLETILSSQTKTNQVKKEPVPAYIA